MTPDPLTNLEIPKCYQNECRFNGAYPRDNLLDKIKNGAYVINLDEYADIGTHSIALYSNGNFQLILTILQSNTFQKKSKSSSGDLRSKDLR